MEVPVKAIVSSFDCSIGVAIKSEEMPYVVCD
jgi:hypothetical protein